jgi:hypothetical protein
LPFPGESQAKAGIHPALNSAFPFGVDRLIQNDISISLAL